MIKVDYSLIEANNLVMIMIIEIVIVDFVELGEELLMMVLLLLLLKVKHLMDWDLIPKVMLSIEEYWLNH
jgi:hypothetical protein